MANDDKGRERGRFSRWCHRNFDDLFFRALIGPAQVSYAVTGGDEAAREHWRRDLEARKRYTREQRERRRAGRLARSAPPSGAAAPLCIDHRRCHVGSVS